MLHAIEHALLDTVKLLPILFLTYLLMEYLEHHSSGKLNSLLQSSRKAGPVFGALLGLIPQCGLSGAAANLYAGGAVTMGTLIAIFLATSDEMLPIMISAQVPVWELLMILGLKLVCGIFVGYLVDWVCRLRRVEIKRDIHDFCEQERCSCEGGIFRSALRHTVQIVLLILIVLTLLELLFEHLPAEKIAAFCNVPVLGEMLTAVLGLLPNCAASVMITNLYVEGIIGLGALLSGLLVNAGVGLLVLFRVNRNRKENFSVAGVLLISGIVLGTALGFAAQNIL